MAFCCLLAIYCRGECRPHVENKYRLGTALLASYLHDGYAVMIATVHQCNTGRERKRVCPFLSDLTQHDNGLTSASLVHVAPLTEDTTLFHLILPVSHHLRDPQKLRSRTYPCIRIISAEKSWRCNSVNPQPWPTCAVHCTMVKPVPEVVVPGVQLTF